MADFPRTEFVPQPTPLTRLNRLSQQLGLDLWIKRDDLAGPSFGGNKARQLEYYFGAAEAANSDTILITGAVQSNFVRTAAACANARGMRAIVQLEDRVPGQDASYRHSGNVFLSRLLGAEILAYPDGEDEAGADAAICAKADDLRRSGARPYVIPLGEGHPPLGALGYMRAAREILDQKPDFDVFVVASGSGATHSGLVAGLRAANSGARVIGSCVRRDQARQRARISNLLAKLRDMTGAVTDKQDVELWDGALAPGYGRIGPLAAEALAMLPRFEGLMLDPVYTAKAFAAIPALVADGTIAKDSKVCFIHSGGLAGLFAYESAIRSTIG